MKTLPNDLRSQYDLEIKKHYYDRSNFILDTNKGKYILRKMNISTEQILFMYDAVNHLRGNGFLQIGSIYPTKKNLPYSTSRGQIYVMQTYKDGKEVEFNELADIKGSIKLLANFHKCGVGFETSLKNSQAIHIKDIYSYFSKRTRETHTLKKKITPLSQKTPFEIAFLKDYQDYEELQKMALDCTSQTCCKNIMTNVQLTNSLAHNDFKYHAIRRMGDNYTLVHIDLCTYNMQVLDFSSILIKIMQKNSWDTTLLHELITIYETIRPLSDDEKAVLKAMLIFPDKFATICNNYLQCKRRNNYSMFAVKWDNMIEYKEEQIKAAHYIKENL
ncbi:MAG: hypothetical protein ATN35_04395 [Epulopiscium sp. Nele67-Bin004]|nr:MAG: hypothetical protein ATN35_04395 [Epulopiscium sp. Nele67-Bin004]